MHSISADFIGKNFARNDSAVTILMCKEIPLNVFDNFDCNICTIFQISILLMLLQQFSQSLFLGTSPEIASHNEISVLASRMDTLLFSRVVSKCRILVRFAIRCSFLDGRVSRLSGYDIFVRFALRLIGLNTQNQIYLFDFTIF